MVGLIVTSMCLAVACSRAGGFAPPARTANDKIADVTAAFEAIPAEGRLLKFPFKIEELPRGGHLQGLQMQFRPAENRHLAFLSHDSETIAYLVVVEFPADLAGEGRALCVHTLPSDGKSPPLRHAGGFQLAGNALAVGVEDNQLKTRSEVQFWDVSTPDKPQAWPHLTIRRQGPEKEWTSGAVGLVARERDHMLVVGNWDCRAVDFYVSNRKPLADPECRFEHFMRWRNDTAEKINWQPDTRFGKYQALNLLADDKGRIYFVGFDTQFDGKDVADLFVWDVPPVPTRMLQKRARKPMRLGGLDGASENHFRYASGLWIEGGRLAVLASPRTLQAETRISIARPAP